MEFTQFPKQPIELLRQHTPPHTLCINYASPTIFTPLHPKLVFDTTHQKKLLRKHATPSVFVLMSPPPKRPTGDYRGLQLCLFMRPMADLSPDAALRE
jgi:hypothetical protein